MSSGSASGASPPPADPVSKKSPSPEAAGAGVDVGLSGDHWHQTAVVSRKEKDFERNDINIG